MRTIDLATKLPYETPVVEVMELAHPLSVLSSLSGEAHIADWEDEGEEL